MLFINWYEKCRNWVCVWRTCESQYRCRQPPPKKKSKKHFHTLSSHTHREFTQFSVIISFSKLRERKRKRKGRDLRSYKNTSIMLRRLLISSQLKTLTSRRSPSSAVAVSLLSRHHFSTQSSYYSLSLSLIAFLVSNLLFRVFD